MVIFHFYVSLPEGKHQMEKTTRIYIWTLLRLSGLEKQHRTNIFFVWLETSRERIEHPFSQRLLGEVCQPWVFHPWLVWLLGLLVWLCGGSVNWGLYYIWIHGWWFGTWILFSIIYGYIYIYGIILPIDELIFFKMVKATNHTYTYIYEWMYWYVYEYMY